MKKKKILVFGSSGFVGMNLTKRLVDEGKEVISFSRRKIHQKGTIQIVGDFRKSTDVDKALFQKPDIIFCLIGVSGQALSENQNTLSYQINVESHISLLDKIKNQLPQAHVIFSSSRLEYGKPIYLPVNEAHPIRPTSIYGFHKHIVTAYCQYLNRRFGLATTVIRASNPYGFHPQTENSHYNVINHFIDLALQGKPLPIYGFGEQVRDYFYIDDFLDALITIGGNPASYGDIFNVGGGTGIKLKTVVHEILRQVGKGNLINLTWPADFMQVETGDYISDISHIKKKIGWKSKISLVSGIRKTLQKQKSV